MAEARQEAEWMRAASMAAHQINRLRWGGAPVAPLALIPPQFRPPEPPPRVLTPEEREFENRMAWRLLDEAFSRA